MAEPKIPRDPPSLTETPQAAYQPSPGDPGFEKRLNFAEDIMRRYRDALRLLAN